MKQVLIFGWCDAVAATWERLAQEMHHSGVGQSFCIFKLHSNAVFTLHI